VQDLRKHAEREARARLSPDAWATAYAAGRTSSIDALLKDIDDVPRRERRPAARRQGTVPVKS
jgi:hypothetical protein